ncbi:MAG: M14 family metallopeptidase [Flavipsychrobacter sp.]|nr:M14 family metallopeptidase [Flavipsychrobacter sp.]
MFYRILLLSLLLPFGGAAQLLTRFETSNGRQTATYAETIEFYETLNRRYTTIAMEEAGPTDTRYPLHVVYYSGDGRFDVSRWKKEGKVILLINNGIHPGEPDGIEACKMLLRDAASGKITVPENVVLAVVPVFNIGGALNRGSYSRANQQGPEEYGFRGSAQNLDLNRDFIKMDAQETRTLVEVFHSLDPDVFIDNHVSNGADYQHIITLLATQHDKLGGKAGKYMYDVFEPALYRDMKERGYDLVPYVNHFGNTPEKGWTEFYDYPRFSSGLAAMFQTMAFVPETHMLKPFRQRVEATYELMRSFIKVASRNARQVKEARQTDREALLLQRSFPLDWKLNEGQARLVQFMGYEAAYKKSAVSGHDRLYYDRSKPYTRQVKFYNSYSGAQYVTAPQAYIVPQGWGNVITRLRLNGVKMRRLNADETRTVWTYRIEKFETVPGPYEGHYYHRNVQVKKKKQKVRLQAGDYIIDVNQPAKRYLVETLEPNGPDAFFAWNFFDAILQQKEYFSDYVFEDEAAELLKNDAALRKRLEQKRKSDPDFTRSASAQLDFVYKNSPYYESAHMRYPVYRVEL